MLELNLVNEIKLFHSNMLTNKKMNNDIYCESCEASRKFSPDRICWLEYIISDVVVISITLHIILNS